MLGNCRCIDPLLAIMNTHTMLARLLMILGFRLALGKTGVRVENAKEHFNLTVEEINIVRSSRP